MENLLGALGTRYKTDKITKNGFHRFYHDVLQHLRDKPLNMLEIGVGQFRSIDMWKQYFPLAMIYGIDSNVQYKDERLSIFKADQSKKDELKEVAKKIQKCSFIVDDGSHVPEHQLLTFDILFNEVLEDGGIYIIESVETSYWKKNGFDYGYESSNTLIEKFKEVVDFLNAKYLSQTDKLKLLEKVKSIGFGTLCGISTITFAQNCIIIKKKQKYEYPYCTGVYEHSGNV